MHIIIFDIDGTLLDSNEIDHLCYLRMLSESLQREINESSFDDGLKLETDTGIAMEMFKKYNGQYPRTFEFNQMKEELVNQFQSELKGEKINPIKGSLEIFDHLRARTDVGLMIATGSWKSSAEFKLSNAGFDFLKVPLITSDSFLSKLDILSEAQKHARRVFGDISSMTYIGDKDWDEKASRALRMDFIKVDKDAEGNDLDERILKTYPNIEDFLTMII